MAKNNLFRCTECGYESIGSFGKCPGCGKWGTMVEKEPEPSKSTNEKVNEISGAALFQNFQKLRV